jgi:hypothetical protein
MVSRLSQCIDAPDGITAEIATARAEDGIALLAPEAEQHLGACVRKLTALVKLCQGEADPPSRAQGGLAISLAASEIHATAGLFARPHLAAAAKLMADAVAHMAQAGRIAQCSLAVYDDALGRMLRDEQSDQEACQTLLAQLRLLAEHELS